MATRPWNELSELETLPRKALQALAKAHHIKANLKSSEIVQLLAEKRSAVEVPGASLLPAHESEAMGDDATEEAAAEPEVTAVSPLEAEMEEQGELAEKRSAVVVPGASLLPAHEKEEEAESEAMGDDPTEEAAAEPEVTAVSPLEAEMEEQGEQQGAPQQQEVMLVVSNPDTAQEVQEEVVSLQPPNDWPVQPSQAVEAMDTLGASGVSNWPLALPSPTVLAEAAAAAAAATTAAAGLDRADSMKLMSDTMELSDSPLVTASTPTTSRKWHQRVSADLMSIQREWESQKSMSPAQPVRRSLSTGLLPASPLASPVPSPAAAAVSAPAASPAVACPSSPGLPALPLTTTAAPTSGRRIPAPSPLRRMYNAPADLAGSPARVRPMPALQEEHTAYGSSLVTLSLPTAPVAAAPTTTSSLLLAISSPAMVASPQRRLALGGGAMRVATPGSVRKAPVPSVFDAADGTENAHPNAPRSHAAATTAVTATGKSPARVSSKAKADPSVAHRIAKRQQAANKRDKERRAAAAAMRAR